MTTRPHPEEILPAAGSARRASPVLLAERHGVVFVATSESVDSLRVPRRYWGADIGIVAIPAHEDEVRSCELLPSTHAGVWPPALARADLLAPAVSRMVSAAHVELSLQPGRDGTKAMLIAPDGQRHPFAIPPKDTLGLLAAVFQHAPRGVVGLGSPRPGRMLLTVRPAARPQEYRLRLAGAVLSPAPRSLAEAGLSPALQEILDEAISRPSGLLLVAGGNSSGRSTTLDLLGASLLSRGRGGGRIGVERETSDPGLPWLADSLADWPFPGSLRESASDFVITESLQGLRHLLLAARLADSGTLVLAGAPAAEPQALLRRVARELETASAPSVPIMVLAQSLVRTVCRACRSWRPIPAGQGLRLGFHRWDLEEMERGGGMNVPFGAGCAECAGTGFGGLTGIFSYAGSGATGSLPSLREEGWRKVIEGGASHADVASLPGAQQALRSLREIAVLAGVTPAPRPLWRDARIETSREATPLAAGGAPAPPRRSTSEDVDTLVRLFRSARTAQPAHPGILDEMARGIAGRAIEGPPSHLVVGPTGCFHLGRHAVSTALLAARIVSALGQGEDAPAAAMLGLLHDVGLLEAGVDPGADLPGIATERSIDPEGLRLHPRAILAALGVDGNEMADRIVGVQAILDAAAAAAQVKTDVRSQAVALASLIDLTHRSATTSCDLHDVASLVVAQHGRRFSPLLFRALLRAIPIFPIGCFVELSSGDVARVVGQNDENHFRPRVEIASGRGRAVERRVVDLSRAPFLHIRQRIVRTPDEESRP